MAFDALAKATDAGAANDVDHAAAAESAIAATPEHHRAGDVRGEPVDARDGSGAAACRRRLRRRRSTPPRVSSTAFAFPMPSCSR